MIPVRSIHVELSIGEQETAGELHDRIAAAGGQLLVQRLPEILRGTHALTAQDDADATYASKIKSADAQLDWRRPAAELARMVLEVAVLNVVPRCGGEFEEAFREAQAIISRVPGYQRHELRRCIEHADRYLLLVWWRDLESHTVGFRESPEYQRWKGLLHHFYDPFPVVEHYTPLFEGTR